MIANVDTFSFILPSDIVSINKLTVTRQTHKNNNVRIECLDIDYHYTCTCILAIMSVSTFKTAIILYIFNMVKSNNLNGYKSSFPM